jgi:hypothetical protein
MLLIVGGALQRHGEGTVHLLTCGGFRKPAILRDLGLGIAGLDDDYADAERPHFQAQRFAHALQRELGALYSDWYGMAIRPPMEPTLTMHPPPWRRMIGSTKMRAALRRPRVPLIQAHTAHSRHPRWDGPATYHSPGKMPLAKIASKHCAARNPRDCLRVYTP